MQVDPNAPSSSTASSSSSSTPYGGWPAPAFPSAHATSPAFNSFGQPQQQLQLQQQQQFAMMQQQQQQFPTQGFGASLKRTRSNDGSAPEPSAVRRRPFPSDAPWSRRSRPRPVFESEADLLRPTPFLLAPPRYRPCSFPSLLLLQKRPQFMHHAASAPFMTPALAFDPQSQLLAHAEHLRLNSPLNTPPLAAGSPAQSSYIQPQHEQQQPSPFGQAPAQASVQPALARMEDLGAGVSFMGYAAHELQGGGDMEDDMEMDDDCTNPVPWGSSRSTVRY